ncbi:serine hydrolase domain-containing protein [Leptospira sarikeiensis]|uniref:Class C beta-lactamase-related serine hydrolase n=1 Tax=Leptospira sarikeiensis TaxID=2484943 RepID=A0A4R9KDW6_9LEPT|nr:serine hydrolase [Leptospira sarikeiensis]TGL64321.1 class C beta-lactamase-related serine hydrolase [Leptospira sarikeiensis]
MKNILFFRKGIIFSLFLLVLSCNREPGFSYSVQIIDQDQKEEIHSLAKWATEEQFQTSGSKIRTNAILVSKNGKIVLEAYSSGFDAETLHPTWSISKFLLNGAVGNAISIGKLDLEKPVKQYLKNSPIHPNEELKVKHLLFFASGLDWKERYEWSPFNSDILEILYGEGNSDITEYISKLNFSNIPGTAISYSSGDSNLLSAVLNSVDPDYSNSLFRKYGIHSYIWEKDPKGVPIASSYAYLSARDLSKIGHIYLEEGWGSASGIFPKNWVRETFRYYDPKIERPWYTKLIRLPILGGHVYLNRSNTKTDDLYYPQISSDSFFASGHWGQFLVVDPKSKLVIVRFGNDRGGRFPMGEFLTKLTKVLEDEKYMDK